MQQSLFQKGQKAIERGLSWLGRHEEEIAQLEDLSAHYKAPYLYAVLGDPLLARRYVERIRNRYLQADGDFRTASSEKGWAHLKCSPANRYVYSNGWIIVGLRKLGVYGMAQQGLDFVGQFQATELGGFYSRFDVATGDVDSRYLDSSSTSSAGLALLACGKTEEAVRAGDFILHLLDAQPEPERYYFSSWKVGSGLMTDVWGDEDQNALYGRKQYCLSTEADPLGELTWLIGKPMKFLCKLYDQTAENRFLEGAIGLFDFFHQLGEARWHNYASCKIMWAGAELYRHTGEPRFARTAARFLEWLCETQYPSGLWLHTLWYEEPARQPLAASLDAIQELCAEISDTLFDLRPSDEWQPA
jgi:hypothetical protein